MIVFIANLSQLAALQLAVAYDLCDRDHVSLNDEGGFTAASSAAVLAAVNPP